MKNSESGVMAQLIKCLLHKHEDPGSIPRCPHKKLGMVVHADYPNGGRWRPEDPQSLLANQPCCISKSQSQETLRQKPRWVAPEK
jgi:hypothetical protein